MIQPNRPLPSRIVLHRWARMTDENYHTQVRTSIARYFGDNERAAYFAHEVYGYRSDGRTRYYKDVDKYLATTDMMMEEIRHFYGDDVFTAVNNCL